MWNQKREVLWEKDMWTKWKRAFYCQKIAVDAVIAKIAIIAIKSVPPPTSMHTWQHLACDWCIFSKVSQVSFMTYSTKSLDLLHLAYKFRIVAT